MFFKNSSAMVSQALTEASWKKTTARVDWVLKLEGTCLTAVCTILWKDGRPLSGELRNSGMVHTHSLDDAVVGNG